MKKILFILLLTGSITQAQVRNYTKKSNDSSSSSTRVKKSSSSSDSDKKFQPIVFGAIQMSNESSDTELDNPTARIGFALGGGVIFDACPIFDVEADLLYGTMGADFNGKKDNLNYIQLPIVLDFKITETGRLGIGPQLGYLLSAEFNGNDYKDSLNSIDYGFVFNAGFGIVDKVGMKFRYYLGFSNINKSYDLDIQNNAFTVGVYYKI